MDRRQHGHASLHGAFERAETYDRVTRWQFRHLYKRVAADVAKGGFPAEARVLDVGTGPGRVPIAIAKAAPALRVEGIDLSENMIKRARENAGPSEQVRFAVGDVANLPYEDDSFDLIVSSMSQHHWPEVEAGMRELRRVLRPTGEAWIYDVRFALSRADKAARSAFPDHLVRTELVRTSWLPVRLIGRVVIRPNRTQAQA
ncbi:MAG TPA: class I SAM-dependent methyltransferase [Micromonosporaceae bacterium]|nr:class I SAM-dependent methyltransferase [Micromonosporaceae bacterium]HCU52313.1 class I SAM-dependent methyltransferase [Micromonosporaceae bacterium]